MLGIVYVASTGLSGRVEYGRSAGAGAGAKVSKTRPLLAQPVYTA